MLGKESLHGPHQDAQKSMYKIFAVCDPSSTGSDPEIDSKEKAGAVSPKFAG
tara:strand:+ start:692 stop:847 length:156 start_codon:yes stop_codon:yes gene_type:complete